MTEIGSRYERLTAIGEPTGKRKMWLCQCDCGTVKRVAQADLRSGHIRSCGCLRRENTIRMKTTHGLTETAEYRTWCHMLGRCYNETDAKYPRYGGRGITVCREWRGDFSRFLADMGNKPTPYHSIERKDNDGPYAPWNCVWATSLEQSQNKSNCVMVEVGAPLDGKKVTVAQAERLLGICAGSVNQMVRKRKVSHQSAVDWYWGRQRPSLTGLGGGAPQGAVQ